MIYIFVVTTSGGSKESALLISPKFTNFMFSENLAKS